MRRESENRTAMPMLSIQPQPKKDDWGNHLSQAAKRENIHFISPAI